MALAKKQEKRSQIYKIAKSLKNQFQFYTEQ